MICFICNKKIKNTSRYVYVGKDKSGNDLIRHLKCSPGVPKFMEKKDG